MSVWLVSKYLTFAKDHQGDTTYTVVFETSIGINE